MTLPSSRANTLLSFSKRKLYMAMLACSPLVMSHTVMAGPEGGKITGGSGQISAEQKQTLIEQYSDRIAIDWDSFDLDADEVVSFLQPGADSVALNRILSESASDIRGRIDANGHVVLVNPRGIVFGESAQVNVGGLLASGLDIGVDDFMNGDFAFSALDGAEGAVINQGTLQASLGGSIGLLGKTVTNEGLIRAELGSVTLAAGKEAVMTFDSDGLIGIRVTESILQDELGVDPAVLNEGSIEAKGGRVLLTASSSRDVFSQAVNTGSLSEARSVVMHGDGSFTLGEGADLVNTGEIRAGHARRSGSAVLLGENVTQGGLIEANAGTGDGGRVELNARSTTLLKRGSETQAQSSAEGLGGEVMALGRYVGAEATASVDASGAEGGGRIYLGGDYRGENPWLPNAEKTIVQAEAELKASATASGDGGRIIVWADESTRFGGHIEAAGAAYGVGGFAEVSGRKQLAFSGTADLLGDRGAGTILLDPEEIVIDGTGLDNPEDSTEEDYTLEFETEETEFSIASWKVKEFLEKGSNVTLEATKSISINHEIEARETPSETWLKLHSGGEISITKKISLGQGSFEAIAGHQTCGDAICQGVEGGRRINVSNDSSISSSGDIVLNATDAIDLFHGTGISGSSITLKSRNTINVGANLTSESGNIQIHAGDSSLDVQDLNYDSEGDHVFTGDLTISGALNSNGSDILLDSAGSVQLFGEAQTVGGDFNVGSHQAPESFYSLEYTDSNSDGRVALGEITREGSIDTSSTLGGGKIIIETEGSDSASGDVRVGSLLFGYPYSTDSEGNEDPLHQKTGSVDITAAWDIYFSRVINFNDTGPRDSDGNVVEGHTREEAYLTAKADGGIHFDADVTSQNATTENGWSSTAEDAVIFDLYGDARDALNISLTADADDDGDGSITTSGDIYTSGGNFSASGQTINFGGAVITRYANALEDGEIEVNDEKRYGVADWSTGGNVELSVSEEVFLGTIVTADSCINDGCEGSFTLSMDVEGSPSEELLVNQASGSHLDIAGDFVFKNLNENAVVNLGLRGTGNRLHGEGEAHSAQVTTTGYVSLANDTDLVLTDFDAGGTLSVSALGSIDIDSASDLTLGTISTQQEGQNGSNITIDSAGSLELEDGSEINASAGARTDVGPGYSGGSVLITAAGDVTLSGKLLTIGAAGYEETWYGDGKSGGAGGDVDITSTGGSVTLSEVLADGAEGYLGNNTIWSNAASGGDAGDITVTSSNEIVLTADLLAPGGARSSGDGDVAHGAGGDISLNGDLVVANSNLVIRNDAGPVDVDGLAEGSDIQAGDFTITGTLDAENPGSLLTLHTGKTTFDGVIGGSGTVSLTELTINSYGDVQFGGNSAPVADQLQVNAVGINEQGLALTNTDNRWVLRDGSESDSYITFNEDQDSHFDFNGFASLTGGSGADHFTVSHSDAVYTFSGGGGENNTLSAYTEDAHSWSLSSDDASNSLTSASEASTDIIFSGIQTLEGSGADTLAGRDQDNAWSVVSAGGGRVQRHLESGAVQDVVNFSGMSTLVGRSQKDIFTVEVGGSIADIQGGEGDNELKAVSNTGDAVSWTLNHENSGGPVIREFGENEPRDASTLVTTFSDIQNLTGSDGSDQFLVQGDASLSGVLDGGAGANNLDFSAWEGVEGEALNIGFGTTDFTWNLKGINEVTGNGADSTLGLAYGSNVWTIDQANGGTISHAAGEGESGLFAGDLTFTNFGNLQGGSGDDEFTLTSTGSISGTVDAGSESGNTLTVAGVGNVWRLDHDDENLAAVSQGEDVRVGAFSDFQTLTGSGSDQFYGHGQTTYWTLSTDNRWSLSSSEADGDGYLTLSGMNKVTGGTGDDHFTLQSGATYTGEIDGGAQADGSTSTNTLAINGDPSLWHLDGRTEEAVVELGNEENVRLDAFRRIQTMEGSGDDQVQGRNAATDWVYDSDAQWTLFEPDTNTNPLITFTGMSKVIGGSGDDRFTLQTGAAYGGDIDGGVQADGSASTNSLTINGDPSLWYLDGRTDDAVVELGNEENRRLNAYSRIQVLQGSGDDQVQGRNEATDWSYGADNHWTLFEPDTDTNPLIAFSGMSKVIGGSGDDHFTLQSGAAYTGEIDGGEQAESTNTLTIKGDPSLWYLDGRTDDAVVELGNQDNLRLNAFSGIQVLKGSGDDHLQGRNNATDWIYGTDSQWALYEAGTSTNPLVAFDGMSKVIGGTGNDRFTLSVDAVYTGEIDGGEQVGGSPSINSLTINGNPNLWYLDGRTENAVVERDATSNRRLDRFSRIQRLEGTGEDQVQGRNEATDWVYGTDNEWNLYEPDTTSNALVSLSGMSKVTGGAGSDRFTLLENATFVGEIGGGSDAGNTLTVNGGTNHWYLDHSGTDVAAVQEGGDTRVDAFSDIQTLEGSGADTFYGRNQSTHWELTTGTTVATNQWILSETAATGLKDLTLIGMGALVGGTAADNFTLADGTVFNGTLDGGLTATNTLSVAGDDNRWNVEQNDDNGVTGSVASRVNQFVSVGMLNGGGSDVLAGADVASTWTLDGADSGALARTGEIDASVQFDGMSALVGGDSTDTFTFSGDTLFAGVIDGGAGSDDTLNLEGLTSGGTAQAVTVGMLAPDNDASSWVARDDDDISIRNIETLTAAEVGNDVGNDTGNQLLGPVSGYYLWTLSGENSGTVQPTSGEFEPNNSRDRVLEFSSFAYLAGGDDSDFRFDGGDATGGITGGSGDTWLDYSLANGDLCFNLIAGAGACDGPLLNNIDGIIGNSSAGFNSQLRANGDEDYVWRIDNNGHGRADGINDGAFEYDGNRVEFIDFNQLVGGAGKDSFLFENGGRLTGYVDGRGDDDIVNTQQSGATMAFRLSEQAPDGTGGSPLWLKGIETIRARNDRANLLIGADLENDWTIDRVSAGRLVSEDQTVTFSGIHSLRGGSDKDDFIFTRSGEQSGSVSGGVNGGEGTDTLSIHSADGEVINWTVDGNTTGSVGRAGTFSGIEVLAGGQGDDHITFTGVQAWVQSIAGGAGANTLTYDVEPNDVNAATWVLSGPRNGSVTLGEAVSDINFTAISALTGSGADTLQGTDNPSEWTISGAHEGTLETSVSGDEQALSFAGMSNLSGGSGDNTLTANGANTWVLTDTGTGSLNEVLNFNGMGELVGDGENNSLQGPDRDNYWFLAGSDQGVVSAASGDAANPAVDGTGTDFVGMTTLIGGQESDQFVASANGALFSGMLNGGEPSGEADDRDSVDLSQRPSDERITVGMGDALNVDVSIANIETLKANPDANNGNQGHTLKGPQAGTYQWIITGTNTGKVFPENDERTDTTLAFHDFAFLEGSESNVFAFEGGKLTGGVTGGSGSNFLDYSNSDEDICIALLGTVSGCDGMAMEGINGIIGNHTDSGSPNSTLRVVGTGDYNWSIQKLDELASSDGINDGIFDAGGDHGIRFIDFNHLVGGDGNHRFEFIGTGEITGSVDGGATRGTGRNKVDTTGSDYGFAFWQSTPSGSGDADTALWVQNIQTLSARSDRHNMLQGVGSATTWTITGTDSGYLGDESLRFEGVQHLKGGSARDTFVVNTGGVITGTIDGGANENTLEVKSDGDDSVGWLVSGENQGSVDDRVASFAGLSELLGGEGNDRFVLTSAGRVTRINAGEGDNALAYQLSGSETAEQAAQWRLTGQYDGEIETANDGISDFENIQSLIGSGHDTLTGDSVATRWLISHSEGGSVGAESTASQHHITFEGMATLAGNTQADHFSILDGGHDFSGVLKGGANGNNRLSANQIDNAWALAGTGRGTLNESITFETIQILMGGGQGNSLTGANRDNRWLLTGEQRGMISEQGVSGSNTEFSGMETLVGGARNDLFVVDSALSVGQLASFEQIRGGAQSEGGADALDLTALSDEGPVSVALGTHGDAASQVAGIEQIEAQGSGNRLYGASDAAYSWTITGLNAGRVSPTASDASDAGIKFTGFSDLTGGTHSDTFALLGAGGVDGTIDGGDGDGIDLVDYSNQAGDVVVTVGDIDSDIRDIEGVVGKSGTGADGAASTLKVADGVNDSVTWTIQRLADLPNSDGINDGEVAIDNHQPFYFINFNRLEGGDGQDAFVLQREGRLLGQINGRGDSNTVSTQDAAFAHRFTVGERRENETRLFNIDSLTTSLNQNHQLVGANGGNTWRIQETGAGELEGQLRFEGIDHLVGGNDTNNFIFSGDGVVSRIEGRGDLADNTLSIEGADAPLLVSLDLNNESVDVRVSGVGALVGNRDIDHRLQGANRPNTWVIDGQDNGTLNSDIGITGFVELLGNADADRFELHGSGAVSGAIDGAGGENTLDLFELADDRELTLAMESQSSEEEPAADVVMLNIGTLAAPTDAGHTLIGRADENLWQLDGENQGTLGDLDFTGVANLIGGNGKDVVEFLSGGSLQGYIDGRGGDNTVDMFEVNRLVNVTVGENQGDLRNITHFIGNNTETTLTSLRADNSWRLDQGENAGRLNTRLNFEGVTDLVGGEGVDTFRLDGGGVTGLIHGGAGDDQFLLTLTPGAEGEQRFSGGAGDDELQVSGGAADYQVAYSPRSSGTEQLLYTAENDSAFSIEFDGLARVQDNVLARELIINTRLDSDTVVAQDNRVQVSDLAELNYRNKTHLTLAANTDDTVELAGALSVPGRLEIRNARVEQTSDEALAARDLRLVSVSEFGTDESPIVTDIDSLEANVGSGGLSLDNHDALSLTQLRSLGDARVVTGGNLTSGADLSVAGVAHFSSEQGSLRLEGANRFSDITHLQAAHDIQLQHQHELVLGDVQAQTLTLNNAGDVQQGEGAWTLGMLDLSVEGNVSAQGADNRIEGLRVNEVADLNLNSRETLRLDTVFSEGHVALSGQGISVDNTLNADSLALDAQDGDLAINRSIRAGGVQLAGARVLHNADIDSAGELTIEASEDIEQNAQLSAVADIQLDAGGELTMSRTAGTQTQTGDIQYSADGNVTVSYLDNPEGIIALSSGRRIESALGEEAGLNAQRIEFAASSGIGARQSIAMATGELHATNGEGRVDLSNTGALRVERLANNGDLVFSNQGNVELDNREGSVFDLTASDAIEAGGVASANYDLGVVRFTVTEGSLLGLGSINAEKPDLVGRRGLFVVDGDIGSVRRPLVMYFKESLVLQGIRSWQPIWGFETRPEVFENNSAFQFSNQDLTSAGEQLVEVEGLEDIDPGIFTAVRNYSFDTVSILMPPDQRYADDDEEDERYSSGY